MNTLPDILIASRTQAGRLLMSTTTGPTIKHVISIGEPGETPCAGFRRKTSRLRLDFADVMQDTRSGDFAPVERDVESVIAFGRRVQQRPGTVLIHCQAGISRSSAAALTLFALWLGPGLEEEAWGRVREARPISRPNRRFVELADALLQRGGALLRAIAT